MIAEPVSSERGDVDDGPGSPVPVQNEVEQPLAIAVVQREEEPTVPGRNSHSLHLSLIHSLQCVHKSTKKNMLHSMMIDRHNNRNIQITQAYKHPFTLLILPHHSHSRDRTLTTS